ncbi:unnamed protein product, partial [Brassica oleracea var. botrytis]
ILYNKGGFALSLLNHFQSSNLQSSFSSDSPRYLEEPITLIIIEISFSFSVLRATRRIVKHFQNKLWDELDDFEAWFHIFTLYQNTHVLDKGRLKACNARDADECKSVEKLKKLQEQKLIEKLFQPEQMKIRDKFYMISAYGRTKKMSDMAAYAFLQFR